MAHPEYIYFAAMFLVALPVAWIARSRIATIVFSVWAIGQALWLIGFPEPETQVVIYIVGLVTGLRTARHDSSIFAAILFLPLALVSLSDAVNWMAPIEAWWSIYWIALTQAASLPFHPDLRTAIQRWRRRSKEGDGMGMLRTVYE